MQIDKYILLIHGPFSGQWLKGIKQEIENFKCNFSRIILVSYISDLDDYKKLIQEINFADIEIITVKDLINPGFFNINRQVHSLQTALRNINDNAIVFKLRNDQTVDFNLAVKYLKEDKILTTNCYTRKDRLYHPSDMFLAASAKLLKDYYSLPLNFKTHLMTEMDNIRAYKEGTNVVSVDTCPEKELCLNYLKTKNHKILNTEQDYLDILKEYFTIANSWNINYRWHKKRTHMFPKNAVILPHYFSIAPFANGPIENAKCFTETDFTETWPTAKDLYYIFMSKLVWYFYRDNQRGFFAPFNRFKDLHCLRIFRYLFLQIFPYFIVKKEVTRLKQKIKEQKND